MTKPRLTPPKWISLVGLSVPFALWLVLAILLCFQPSRAELSAGEELYDLPEIRALDINHQDFSYQETGGSIHITVDGLIADTQQHFHERFRQLTNGEFQVWQEATGNWISLEQWRRTRVWQIAAPGTSRP
jgi:hypothetical protein